jgi:hypothetical protein
MTLIEHIELDTAGQASIVFDLIPATYTDLYLVVSARSNRTVGEVDDLKVKFNTSSSNITSRALYGTGAVAVSGTATDRLGWVPANGGATANTFGNASFYIPNYTSSNAKSLSADTVTENNATDVILGITAMLWNPSPQAAINEIEIYPLNGTQLMQYSSATLYGITAGSDGTTTVS